MADKPPYMNAYGNVSKILTKIREAQTPDRFTQDYLGTVLGFTGGGARPFIPLARRLGLLGPDGAPTDLYRRFRGSKAQSEIAMAEAIRRAYSDLYKRNEYAHKLSKTELQGMLTEITGSQANSPSISNTIGTFEALKKFANFDTSSGNATEDRDDGNEGAGATNGGSGGSGASVVDEGGPTGGVGLRFGYTITLNLPDTNDITVFNAIFKSLKENLLS